MVNKVRLTASILDGKAGRPAVREIKKRDTGAVLGYGCRVRYGTGDGVGFTSLTHWSPSSPLRSMGSGESIEIDGSLGFESWTSDDGQRSQVCIVADVVTASQPAPVVA